jgi:hypothetical protein
MMDENGGFCKKSDESAAEMVDWIYRAHDWVDLRQMLVYCGDDGMYSISLFFSWHEAVDWGECVVYQVSPISNRPVCYTTETNKYG